MGTNEDPTGGGSDKAQVIPRLTLGQRILASLPTLQRSPTKDNGQSAIKPDEVLAPDSPPAAARRSWRDAFTAPPKASRDRTAPSGMSREELNHVIKRIDDREKTYALWAAALGFVLDIVITARTLADNPPLHHKGHTDTTMIVVYGAVGLVLAGVVALATWKRRRSFVAFSLLFLGTTMGFPLALAFWALALWMIFRVMKWQKELAAMTKGQATGRTEVRSPATSASGAVRSTPPTRTPVRTRGRRKSKQPEPAGPSQSKRYTPPNTVRPRLPGS
jgi:hypothetical protein